MAYKIEDFNPAHQERIKDALRREDQQRTTPRPAAAPSDPAPAAALIGEPPPEDSDLYPSSGTPKKDSSAQHIPGRMNDTERRYSALLNLRITAGEVVWWSFESVKFRIGHNCYYTPDFIVQLTDGSVELHETKGHMRDDARVKISVMKEMYPFFIWLIRWEKEKGQPGTWKIGPA